MDKCNNCVYIDDMKKLMINGYTLGWCSSQPHPCLRCSRYPKKETKEDHYEKKRVKND